MCPHIMSGAPLISRAVAFAALVVTFGVNGLGADKRAHVFNSGFEAVWAAAVDVAKGGFLLDKISKEEGRLRFRTGPLRVYRFEVAITDVGGGKTRVELELRSNRYSLPAVSKEAWRNGNRYLTLLGNKLDHRAGK